MENRSWEKLAPLTGVVFVALVVVAFAGLARSTPGTHASALKVQTFYADHHSREQAAAFVLAISTLFLLFFVSSLRHALRSAGGTGRLANASFAGGVVAAGGFLIAAAIHFALADAADSVKTVGVTQTLNVLDNDSFLPFASGLGVLMLASGLSTLRHGGLPRWLGWIAVVFGVAIFTPAGFIGFFGSGLWILVTSAVLAQRGTSAQQSGAAAA
jgi:hypothetical protein